MSRPIAPYVSKELIHFVGRSAQSDAEAFDRLVTILQDRWLLSREARAIGDRDENVTHLSLSTAEALSTNDRWVPSMVCFADIPMDALAIHVAKYRRFGIAFTKTFLIGKGARPVYYVPKGGRTTPLATYDDLSEDWDEIAHILPLEIDPRFDGTTRSGTEGNPEVGANPAERISDWIAGEMLAFVKFFDPDLPDDHVDNFYMEREWRTVRNVSFDRHDIAHVYVARGFGARLRAAIPTLGVPIREIGGIGGGRVRQLLNRCRAPRGDD